MHEIQNPVQSVAVLLCTFNGELFLEEQLESLRRQRNVRVHVYASDDGSRDQTLHLLNACRESWGETHLSIRSLICSDIEADYFAYADQDDIWDPDKLSRALAAMSALGDETPVLYCSRTRLISQDGVPFGLSPHFRKEPAFANALIQNIGSGNTMVLNRKARELLRAAGPVDIPSHDWWTYILVSAAGGTVLYDPTPTLKYRQHEGNLIGSNETWRDRFTRFSLALGGRNKDWNTRNIMALQKNRAMLSAQNLEVLELFNKARDAKLFPRLSGVRKSGVYAQTIWGNLALMAMTFLKKL